MYQKIKNLCKENAISVAQLEKDLRFSNNSISKWDKSDPSVKKVAAVANYFDKPIEYFLPAEKDDVNE